MMTKADHTDTRGLILDTAVPLFAAGGYSGISMRTMAKQVGISAAALYHHYPDKHPHYLPTTERNSGKNQHDIF